MSRGYVIWFRGLNGSGKTTISKCVYDVLRAHKIPAELLDDDVVIPRLKKGLNENREDILSYIKRLGWVSQILARNDIIVLTASETPVNAPINEIREEIKDFIEIYLKCSPESYTQRKRPSTISETNTSELANTSEAAVFETPENPDLILETDKLSIDECVNAVVEILKSRGILSAMFDSGYSEDEEAEIRKRLEDLGYL